MKLTYKKLAKAWTKTLNIDASTSVTFKHFCKRLNIKIPKQIKPNKLK